jgi:hypothetical protein
MDNLNKKITITANAGDAEAKLTRLQEKFEILNLRMEALNQRFENVSRAGENFMGKLERLGIASVFAEGGLFGLVNKVADVGYELGEASVKTGLSTQQFQYWSFAAKQSGADADTLLNALRFVNVAMGDAHNPTSQQAQAFRYLGISMKDINGKAKDTNAVFTETMKKLGSMTDIGKQNKVSLVLFSRSFQQLLPLMKSVSEGSKQNEEDFKKYGIVLNEDAIKASDKFHRSSINLRTSFESLGEAIGFKLMPILQPLIDSMADYASKNRQVLAANISSVILDIAKAFRDAWGAMKPVVMVLGGILQHLGGLKTLIITLVSYYFAGLIKSFVVLSYEIGVATIAMGRFIAANVLSGVEALVSVFGRLRSVMIGLDVVAILNPITLTIMAVSAAVVALSAAIYELYKHWGQIKAAFSSSPMLKGGGSIMNAFNSGGLAKSSAPALQKPVMANNGIGSLASRVEQMLTVHLKIDKDGNPQVATAQSNKPINFSTNLGLLR